MTTIAWDGRAMAADSQSTTDSIIYSMNERKIYTSKNGQLWSVNGEKICFFGAAGDCGTENAIIDAMIEGITYKTEWPEMMDFSVIAVTEEGSTFLIFKDSGRKSASISSRSGAYAIGSGGVIARTAMHLGYNAIDAVRTSIEIDVRSGGDIQTISLDDILKAQNEH